MEIRPTMTDSVARLAGSYSIILFIMRLHRVALYSRTFVERGSHLCSCVLYSGHVRNVKKVSQRMLGICRFYHARLMYREHLHANTRKKWNETHNARDSRASQNDAIWLLNWLLQWRVHFGKVAKSAQHCGDSPINLLTHITWWLCFWMSEPFDSDHWETKAARRFPQLTCYVLLDHQTYNNASVLLFIKTKTV